MKEKSNRKGLAKAILTRLDEDSNVPRMHMSDREFKSIVVDFDIHVYSYPPLSVWNIVIGAVPLSESRS